MQIINVIKKATISRLNGGIILDSKQNPIHRKEYESILELLKINQGQSCYYHVDEDTMMLTKYEKRSGYKLTSSCELTLPKFRIITLAFETLHGFNPNTHRYRIPFVYLEF